MLSRVADSMYWMQRYRERAENIARLIDVNLYLSIDAPGDDAQQWEPIVKTTGDAELFREFYGKATQTNAIEFLTFDERNPNSILSCLYRSRENARSIRETITFDMWHELNTLYLYVRRVASTPRKKMKSLFDFYTHIRRSCQLFTGIADTTMSHSEAWHFARIGNLLERADQTTRILDAKYFILLPSVHHVGSSYDDILWAALLKSVSGLEMYRKKYHEIHHAYVIDFFILDPLFPRSFRSCLLRTKDSLAKIAASHQEQDADPLRRVDDCCQQLENMSVYDITKRGLHEYIDSLQTSVSKVSESISATYFAPWRAETNPTLEAYAMAFSQQQAE